MLLYTITVIFPNGSTRHYSIGEDLLQKHLLDMIILAKQGCIVSIVISKMEAWAGQPV